MMGFGNVDVVANTKFNVYKHESLFALEGVKRDDKN